MNCGSLGAGVVSAVRFVPRFVSTPPDVHPTESVYPPESLEIVFDFRDSLNRLFFFFGFAALAALGAGLFCFGRPFVAPLGRLFLGAGLLRLAIVNRWAQVFGILEFYGTLVNYRNVKN